MPHLTQNLSEQQLKPNAEWYPTAKRAADTTYKTRPTSCMHMPTICEISVHSALSVVLEASSGTWWKLCRNAVSPALRFRKKKLSECIRLESIYGNSIPVHSGSTTPLRALPVWRQHRVPTLLITKNSRTFFRTPEAIFSYIQTKSELIFANIGICTCIIVSASHIIA